MTFGVHMVCSDAIHHDITTTSCCCLIPMLICFDRWSSSALPTAICPYVRTYAANSPGPPNQLTVDDYVRCGTNSYNVVKRG